MFIKYFTQGHTSVKTVEMASHGHGLWVLTDATHICVVVKRCMCLADSFCLTSQILHIHRCNTLVLWSKDVCVSQIFGCTHTAAAFTRRGSNAHKKWHCHKT